MTRPFLLQFGFGVLTSAAVTMAGCASSAKTALDSAPPQVLAASDQNTEGWWNRMKAWLPQPAAVLPDAVSSDEDEVENPGKLHVAYARWQEKLGNLVEARKSYNLALKDDPDSADAILGLARLDQLNGRTFEAEQRFLKALQLKPDDADVLDSVAQFYAAQERWDKSIDLLSESMRLAPHDKGHRFNLAVALARAGRIDEAMPHFSRTVGDAEAHYNVGYILYQKNDLVGAERHLMQAVVARPELEQAQQMLDEVRQSRSDRLMFADGSPANSTKPAPRNNTRPPMNAGRNLQNAGRVQPAAATAAAPESKPDFQKVVPAGSTRANDPRNYRLAAGRTRAGASVGRSQVQPAHSSRVTSPPPWRTSPSFAPPVRTAGPTRAPLAGPPGIDNPTPAQLEQWRNQRSPAAGGPRY